MFNYELPKERIADRPVGVSARRDSSKLLHITDTGAILDRFVKDLPRVLSKGDLLVVNNTKVQPYRFFPRIGETQREVLLVSQISSNGGGTEIWECLARPMKKFAENVQFDLSESIEAKSLGRNEAGDRLVLELVAKESGAPLEKLFLKEGSLPIPPYIRKGRSDTLDSEFYQTVFAKTEGSIAAPTAGLHFTEELFEHLREGGVEIAELTLHVGVGSFLPIQSEDSSSHDMVVENFVLSESLIDSVLKAKDEKRRVVAVGTTTVRALEGAAVLSEKQSVSAAAETPCNPEQPELFQSILPGHTYGTDIFISPGYRFRVVDALFTNFHQPRSTHLSLVSAFSGESVIQTGYQHALEHDYRFLSYGDAMFLEKSA